MEIIPLLNRARSDVEPHHAHSVSSCVIIGSNSLVRDLKFFLRDAQSASGPQRAYIDGRAIINQSHRYIELPTDYVDVESLVVLGSFIWKVIVRKDDGSGPMAILHDKVD